jgi:predicted  nucleic acid-binding Zn-ribbon protein
MSSEYPAVNGNGSGPPEESSPEPLQKWDIQAMEELLETIVSKQVTLAGQVEEVELQVKTLRQIVENSINVQLQDRQETLRDRQDTQRKLDALLMEVSRTFPVVPMK